MAGNIDLKELMNILKSGTKISDLKVFTANLATKKGGELLHLKNCILSKQSNKEVKKISNTTVSKAQNHHANFTVNMLLEDSQRILTIHPILVYSINNYKLL